MLGSLEQNFCPSHPNYTPIISLSAIVEIKIRTLDVPCVVTRMGAINRMLCDMCSVIRMHASWRECHKSMVQIDLCWSTWVSTCTQLDMKLAEYERSNAPCWSRVLAKATQRGAAPPPLQFSSALQNGWCPTSIFVHFCSIFKVLRSHDGDLVYTCGLRNRSARTVRGAGYLRSKLWKPRGPKRRSTQKSGHQPFSCERRNLPSRIGTYVTFSYPSQRIFLVLVPVKVTLLLIYFDNVDITRV